MPQEGSQAASLGVMQELDWGLERGTQVAGVLPTIEENQPLKGAGFVLLPPNLGHWHQLERRPPRGRAEQELHLGSVDGLQTLCTTLEPSGKRVCLAALWGRNRRGHTGSPTPPDSTSGLGSFRAQPGEWRPAACGQQGALGPRL